jgi:hypothetical protein
METKKRDLFLGSDNAESVTPKISEHAWESGEGGNQDQGENPADGYAEVPRR